MSLLPQTREWRDSRVHRNDVTQVTRRIPQLLPVSAVEHGVPQPLTDLGVRVMTTLTGIARIETVGAIVRGPYGQLCRITEVIESSRLTVNHVSSPLDVVVRTEPVGSPGYGHESAWASDLTMALPTDRFGAHVHREGGCRCGMPFAPTVQSHLGWYAMPPSWEIGR